MVRETRYVQRQRHLRNVLRWFMGWVAETRRVQRQREWQRLMLWAVAFARCHQRRCCSRYFQAWRRIIEEALVEWLLQLPLAPLPENAILETRAEVSRARS